MKLAPMIEHAIKEAFESSNPNSLQKLKNIVAGIDTKSEKTGVDSDIADRFVQSLAKCTNLELRQKKADFFQRSEVLSLNLFTSSLDPYLKTLAQQRLELLSYILAITITSPHFQSTIENNSNAKSKAQDSKTADIEAAGSSMVANAEVAPDLDGERCDDMLSNVDIYSIPITILPNCYTAASNPAFKAGAKDTQAAKQDAKSAEPNTPNTPVAEETTFNTPKSTTK
jgi:hypothetical protein